MGVTLATTLTTYILAITLSNQASAQDWRISKPIGPDERTIGKVLAGHEAQLSDEIFAVECPRDLGCANNHFESGQTMHFPPEFHHHHHANTATWSRMTVNSSPSEKGIWSWHGKDVD